MSHNTQASTVDEISRELAKEKIGRRQFFKLGAAAGGGFALALCLPNQAKASTPSTAVLNAFVTVSNKGEITLFAHMPDMGQGVKTSLPMIIAEELGANWDDVTVVNSAVNAELYGAQRSGGSRSVPENFERMRQVGASAREMFKAAAAAAAKRPQSEFTTDNSFVVHTPSNKRWPFADLASAAAQQPVPSIESLTFKKREDYQLLGTEVGSVDNRAIVTGEPLFGVDVVLPNMLYANYTKCPAFYGTVKSANIEQIKKLPGVVDAFILQGNSDSNELMPGVAIVARSTWQAFNAKRQLNVEWDESKASKDNWQSLCADAEACQKLPGSEVTAHGNLDKALAEGDTLEAMYTHPYVAHACMEPMNCTAHFNPQAGTMEVWVPSQVPGRVLNAVDSLLGIPASKVTIHQRRMGGAFGRRGRTDFSSEACVISHRMGAPVKLTWTREDDMQHDHYRAGGFHALRGIVKGGKLTGFETHLIGVGHGDRPAIGTRLYDTEFPAQCVDNYRAAMTLLDTKTPCGPWRAPGSNVTAWAVQSFIAELAHKAERDHLEFLLEIMGEPRWFEPGNLRSLNTGRAAAVIKLAAEKAGWGKPLPKGRGLGLAFHFSHAGHVAEVAEVSVDSNKKLTVHKVTAAVDIGPVMNMSGARGQVEGSIVDGLSTMLGLEITMKDGRIEQGNFDRYRPMFMKNTPAIDVHFIQSDNHPTGIGEPALPPLAPAIGNAIFAATGERLRTMPISKEGYSV